MKSRFCPSPTGLLHLGNMRTALFNDLIAKGKQGCFLLRIEDTDQTRSTGDYAIRLMEDLHWLGLHWQEGPDVEGSTGPYWQSQRQVVYDKYYALLEQQGAAYPCFCSEEQLALNRKMQRTSGRAPRYPGTCRNLTQTEIQTKRKQGLHPTLRFKIPTDQTIEFNDKVRGPQRFASHDIGDFIIRRADGTASFMYCNALDDALMGVTLVLRGEDHLTNTPRQILILKALGLSAPQYGHMSLIFGSDGAPLSKRNGSRSIHDLREQGILPLALTNYLARLGHHYDDETLMTEKELATNFSLSSLGRAPARFDETQLLYWQREAIKQASPETLWQWMREATRALVTEQSVPSFIETIRPNITYPTDAHLWANIIFTDHIDYGHEEKQILKNAGVDFLDAALAAVSQYGVDFKAITQALKQSQQVKGKGLFMPLRVALTGEQQGPEMLNLLPLMGQERAKLRFEHALYAI